MGQGKNESCGNKSMKFNVIGCFVQSPTNSTDSSMPYPLFLRGIAACSSRRKLNFSCKQIGVQGQGCRSDDMFVADVVRSSGLKDVEVALENSKGTMLLRLVRMTE